MTEKTPRQTYTAPVAKIVKVGDIVPVGDTPCKVIHINDGKQRFSLQPQPVVLDKK